MEFRYENHVSSSSERPLKSYLNRMFEAAKDGPLGRRVSPARTHVQYTYEMFVRA